MADTSLPNTPLTLLDAVNTLLRTIGLSEVPSLVDTDGNKDSFNAFSALGRANASIQAMGWHGNTEILKLTPITLPLPTKATTNGSTAAGNSTLHFAAVDLAIKPGDIITNTTHPTSLTVGTNVIPGGTSTTVLMSVVAIGAGVSSGDALVFTHVPPPNIGQIAVPPNYLMVRPVRNTEGFRKKVTVRGGYLYNLTDSTFLWGTANTLWSGKPIDVEVVQSLAFEDLPQALRWYITCRAGRMFSIGTYPSSGTFRFTEDEEAKAKALAQQEDELQRDSDLPETSPFFGRMRRR